MHTYNCAFLSLLHKKSNKKICNVDVLFLKPSGKHHFSFFSKPTVPVVVSSDHLMSFVTEPESTHCCTSHSSELYSN